MNKLIGPAALLALLLAACHTPVKVDYDTGANYSSFKTFAWVAPRAKATPQGTDNASSIMDRRIRQTLVRELEARGFRQETTPGPDFLVSCRPHWKNHRTTTSFYVGAGSPNRPMGTSPRTRVTDTTLTREGSIILEIRDGASRKLVWRAVAEGSLSGEETPEEAEEVVGREVRRMLEKFPPHKAD